MQGGCHSYMCKMIQVDREFLKVLKIVVIFFSRHFAKDAFVDLTKIKGLKGVYIASQLTKNNSFQRDEQRSMITFDKGGEWSLINPPAYDINGNKTKNCTSHSVSWTLYIRSSMDLFFMNLCVLIDLIIKMHHSLVFVHKTTSDKRCR